MKIITKNVLFLGWDQEYETTSIDAIKSHTVYRFVFPAWIAVIYKLTPPMLKNILLRFLCSYITSKFKNFNTLIVPDNCLYYELALKLRVDKKLMLIRNVVGSRKWLLQSTDMTHYTFDALDARKYNINLYNQFLYLEGVEEKQDIYQVYYLGLIKDRQNAIDNLRKALNSFDVSNLILAKERPKSIWDRVRCKIGQAKPEHEFIEYSQNINFVNESQIVVDIVNGNQSGLTLRVLEALFLNKKLITNNKHITTYEFFDGRYIKVIDFEDYDAILHVVNDKDFLNAQASYEPSSIYKFRGDLVLEEILNAC